MLCPRIYCWFSYYPYSLAVEGLDPEKIGIEEILVSKEVEFFVEEHIQNPPKSTLGKLFYSKLKFAIKNEHGTL